MLGHSHPPGARPADGAACWAAMRMCRQVMIRLITFRSQPMCNPRPAPAPAPRLALGIHTVIDFNTRHTPTTTNTTAQSPHQPPLPRPTLPLPLALALALAPAQALESASTAALTIQVTLLLHLCPRDIPITACTRRHNNTTTIIQPACLLPPSHPRHLRPRTPTLPTRPTSTPHRTLRWASPPRSEPLNLPVIAHWRLPMSSFRD